MSPWGLLISLSAVTACGTSEALHEPGLQAEELEDQPHSVLLVLPGSLQDGWL